LASRFSSFVRWNATGALDSVGGTVEGVEVLREVALVPSFVRFDVLAIANSAFVAVVFLEQRRSTPDPGPTLP